MFFCFFFLLPSHSVVGAISALSIVVIAAVFWDMSVRVRLCVLWNYISEVWDRHLKKTIIPILMPSELTPHKSGSEKNVDKEKKKKENPLSPRL